MIWSPSELRALEAVPLGRSEVVYAFISLDGEPSEADDAFLDEHEKNRSLRFVRAADRRRFTLAHVALRVLLARCLRVEPAAVRYENGAHGKPALSRALEPLEFNLSHSSRLALIAVARERPVGVDLERIREMQDVFAIAESHFSTAERQALRSVPKSDRRAAFFRCWTRKEAVIKAIGEGFARELGSFDVDLAPGSTAALKRFDGQSGKDAGLSLRDLPSPPGYAAAGAVVALPSIAWRWRELVSK
jgi:4'-phosphopantetheinyl transferase